MMVFGALSHPSEKQCAAVTTQHGEMRVPPQRNFCRRLKIAATHGCDSMGVKEPPTTLYILLSDLSPHVSSAGTYRTGQWPQMRGPTKWEETVFKQQTYLYPHQEEVVLLVLNLWGSSRQRSFEKYKSNMQDFTDFKHPISALHLGTSQSSCTILVPLRTRHHGIKLRSGFLAFKSIYIRLMIPLLYTSRCDIGDWKYTCSNYGCPVPAKVPKGERTCSSWDICDRVSSLKHTPCKRSRPRTDTSLKITWRKGRERLKSTDTARAESKWYMLPLQLAYAERCPLVLVTMPFSFLREPEEDRRQTRLRQSPLGINITHKGTSSYCCSPRSRWMLRGWRRWLTGSYSLLVLLLLSGNILVWRQCEKTEAKLQKWNKLKRDLQLMCPYMEFIFKGQKHWHVVSVLVFGSHGVTSLLIACAHPLLQRF